MRKSASWVSTTLRAIAEEVEEKSPSDTLDLNDAAEFIETLAPEFNNEFEKKG